MRSLGLVLLLARARGAIQGLKGVACVNPMYSNGLDGCVFANDNTREVCWLDLASREAFLMPGDYDRPHEVAITRDGSLVVVADWYGGTLTKITPNDAGAGATFTQVSSSATVLPDEAARAGFWKGAGPDAVEIAEDGRRAYVSLDTLGAVASVDLATGTSWLLVGGGSLSEPHGVTLRRGAAPTALVGVTYWKDAQPPRSEVYELTPTGNITILQTGPAHSHYHDIVYLYDDVYALLDRNLNAVLLYDRGTGSTTLLAGAPDGLRGFTDGWGREVRFDDPHAITRYDNVSLVVADTRNVAPRRVHFRGPRFGHVETIAKFSSNDLSCPILAADTMAIGTAALVEQSPQRGHASSSSARVPCLVVAGAAAAAVAFVRRRRNRAYASLG